MTSDGKYGKFNESIKVYMTEKNMFIKVKLKQPDSHVDDIF